MLHGLDPRRRGYVILFLSDSRLISIFDLSEADLTEASLSLTHLESANLILANLESAHLKHAHLESANLKVANLSRSDLSLRHSLSSFLAAPGAFDKERLFIFGRGKL